MTIAVLVMTYGTPPAQEDIATFYTDIRRGRPPTREEVDDLRRRYDAIGGLSPLTERSMAQVSAIQHALDDRRPAEFIAFYGTKHSTPSIADAIEQIASTGIDEMVGIVLAPHYSALSVGDYIERADAAAQSFGVTAHFIEQWHDLPELITLLSTRVNNAKTALDGARNIAVVFTAHSLPSRIVEMNDPYVDQLTESAAAISQQCGIERYRIGWQSAGRTREPWLGPDITELLTELASDGYDAVIVCPQGFTSDHLEVLYDLDVVARARATELGLSFVRTQSLNDDPLLAHGLSAIIIERYEALRQSAPQFE